MPHHIPLVVVVGVAWLLAGAGGSAHAAGPWAWPVRGEVITAYRNGADPYAGGQHRGVDLAAPSGTRVVAATAGGVRFSGVAGSSGLTVSIRTADGRFDTSYLHLATALVREGERVSAGEGVGTVGTSGRRSAAQPHLHFGVREAGSRHAYRNPLDFLPPLPAPPAPETPRGGPVPVGSPVRTAPAPAPVMRPAPVRARGRVRAGRPLRGPSRAGRRVRVPAGRGVRVPVSARPGVRSAQVPAEPVPSGRGALGPAGGAVEADRARVPGLGPSPGAVPTPGGSARDPATSRAGPAGEPTGGAPDLGWALACVGLLLAAACIGGSRSGGATTRGRSALRALMRPLVGGR